MCINCHVSVLITYFSKYLFYIYCYNFAMKNKSIALTLGILLISSALLVSIPKNVNFINIILKYM